jgi:hypothetical protein
MRLNLRFLVGLLVATTFCAGMTVFIFVFSKIAGGFVLSFVLLSLAAVLAVALSREDRNTAPVERPKDPDALSFDVLASQAPKTFHIHVRSDGSRIDFQWVDDDCGYGGPEAIAAMAYALQCAVESGRGNMRRRFSPEMRALFFPTDPK